MSCSDYTILIDLINLIPLPVNPTVVRRNGKAPVNLALISPATSIEGLLLRFRGVDFNGKVENREEKGRVIGREGERTREGKSERVDREVVKGEPLKVADRISGVRHRVSLSPRLDGLGEDPLSGFGGGRVK